MATLVEADSQHLGIADEDSFDTVAVMHIHADVRRDVLVASATGHTMAASLYVENPLARSRCA